MRALGGDRGGDHARSCRARGSLIHVFRAGAYLGEERLPEAEAECYEALRIDPKAAGAYYNLACAALAREDPDAALSRLMQAVEAGGDKVRAILERDTDVDPLRGDPRFAGLLE